MQKFGRVLVSHASLFFSFFLVLLTAAPLHAQSPDKLAAFQSLSLGSSFEQFQSLQSCDTPADVPGIPGSSSLGLTSTICPVGETFAMGTLLDQKLVAVAVNWVSWRGGALLGDLSLQKIPAALRQQYGVPEATVAYERRFGNPQADRYCADQSKKCQIHIWKSAGADRVASLVYAKDQDGEIPLLFNLNDLTAEKRLKERLGADTLHASKASRKAAEKTF